MTFEEKEKNELPEEENTERTVEGLTSADVTLCEADENAELLDEVLEEDAESDTSEEPEKEKKWKLPRIQLKRDGRRIRVGAAATAFTVVVVAAIFLLNIIVGIVEDRWPITVDTTEEKIYTLSDEAADFAKAIEKDVEIVVCLPESTLTAGVDVSGQQYPYSTWLTAFNSMYKHLHATLDSFRTLSGGKVTVKYVDLEAQPLLAATYTELGAAEGSVVFISGDNSLVRDLSADFTDYSMTELYNYYYEGQTLTPNSIVETALANSINAVSGDKVAGVVLLTGHNANEYVVSDIGSLLSKAGYTVTEVDITTQAAIPEDAGLLVIPAPNEDYTENEITRIRRWVENENRYNHHLMVVPSLVETPNIEMYVEDTLGVVITEDLVSQSDSSYIYSGIQNPLYSYADAEDSDYSEAGRVLAPYTRRLLLTGDRPEFTTLFSFPESGRLSSLEDVYAAEDEGSTEYPMTEAPAGDYPLVGAALSNTFYGAEEGETYGIVVGSFYFMTGLTSIEENGDLIEGVVNKVLDKEDGVEFEDKVLDVSDTLTVDSAATALTVMVIFVIMIPVATLVVCLIVFLKRRHL